MYTLCEQDKLANLLFMASYGRQGAETAERLMKRFGSFANVFAAGRGALERCGLTESQAALILSLRFMARRCALERFGRSPDLGSRGALEEYIRALYVGVRNERFILLCLNGQDRLIESRTLADGTLRGLRVHPRTLFESVVQTGASRVVFCHNHPGGKVAFSHADIRSTRVFWAQLNAIGVTLVDHMLCAGEVVVSMRETCRLDGTFYLPPRPQAPSARPG